MDSNLTVEKAKTTVWQKAAILEQGQELEDNKECRESLEELEKSMAELQASMDELKQQPKFGQRHRGAGKRMGTNFKAANFPSRLAVNCSKSG